MQDKEFTKRYYTNYIQSRKAGYEITLAIVGQIISKLQEDYKISNDVKVLGRIKSFESAYENNNKKAVDDCFGIRIIAQRIDLQEIKNNIENNFIIKKNKRHIPKDKKDYDALHQMGYINFKFINKNNARCIFPVVEIQYWTIQLENKTINGILSYSNYKKDFHDKVLKEYRNNSSNLKDYLPIYYEIENNKLRELPARETLYKLYPEIEEMNNTKYSLNT